MAPSSSGLGHSPFTGKITGSNPVGVTRVNAWVVEWLMAPDCKSGDESLRWFESNPMHQILAPIAQW